MRHHKGKSFFANPRLFRAPVALYFPNFHGTTLDSAGKPRDTTDVLHGHVSIVSVFSSVWAEDQVRSWLGEDTNPELHELLRQHQQDNITRSSSSSSSSSVTALSTSLPLAQRVEINIEENAVKGALVSLFAYRLRAQRPTTQHDKYFIVKKGVRQEIRDTIGLLNSRVGYIYLVDQACRIRWAGSGIAAGDELQYLNRGLKKLLDEAAQPPSASAIAIAAAAAAAAATATSSASASAGATTSATAKTAGR